MTNTRDLIIQLKQVKEEKGLSYSDILNLMEKNGDYLAKSTLSRVFAEGSEDCSFKYEETIRPIAIALLDIDTIEEDDDKDVRAMKQMIQLNTVTIQNNKQQIEHLQAEHTKEILDIHSKIDHERTEWNDSIAFLKNQIRIKDDRIDSLLKAVQLKDSQYQTLLDTIMSCPCRKAKEIEI